MPLKNLLFTREEFAQRTAALRRKMQESGVALVLLDQNEHMFHIAGYQVSDASYRAFLVPLEGAPLAVLRGLDVAPFLERAWFDDHIGYPDWEDPLEVLATAPRERG